MYLSSIIKGLALTASLTGAVLAQGTTPTWIDHIPAPGVRAAANINAEPGAELKYHHVSANIPVGVTVTWDDPTMPYYMDRDILVYGQLNVLPGNWIFGGTWAQLDSSAFGYGTSLIIMEGGKAHMVGTPDSTIVMTGFGDDFRDIACFGPGVKGTWGGLIIKGLAPVSNAWPNGMPLPPGITEAKRYPSMEGVATYQPDSIKKYGKGDIATDNSGEYAYLSIRHGGCGNASMSEINGISFYGVGSGTTMHHIEVMSNYDDGIELFGGTVNIHHICISFCDDDQFDMDQGYSGKIQFAFGTELNWMGNRSGEWDGIKNYVDRITSAPTIANMTLISGGKYTSNNKNDQNYGNMFLIQLADSLKGTYKNILALDGSKYCFWMRGHDLKTAGKEGVAPMGPNGPQFSGFMTFNCNATQVWDSLVADPEGNVPGAVAATIAYLNNPANKCYAGVDPLLRGVSREFGFAALDPRPCAQSPVFSSAVATPADPFFTTANYVGAFNSSDLWCDGWTKLSQAGCLSSNMSTFPEKAIVPINSTIDLTYMINDPTAVPVGASILLDGVDVSSAVLPMLVSNNGAIACGGLWLKAPGIPISAVIGAFPGTNYMGLHVFKTSLTLADGRVLTGVSRIKVTQ
jgi:hypothetical protein